MQIQVEAATYHITTSGRLRARPIGRHVLPRGGLICHPIIYLERKKEYVHLTCMLNIIFKFPALGTIKVESPHDCFFGKFTLQGMYHEETTIVRLTQKWIILNCM